MKRKYFIAIVIGIVLVTLGIHVHRSIKLVSEMFKLNTRLQAEGYYMGDFEFKMLGCAYYIDKGKYITAFSKLNEYHKQLESKNGLIKIPKFRNKKEEMEFYLNLQNPETGAFMDESYPMFTYIGPTSNILEHLESLSKNTGEPLYLKYPLRFLNQINSSDKLNNFLDDLAFVGKIGSKLPKTSYMEIAELCGFGDLVERNHLYTFSQDWKQSFLKWLYENQDSKTGLWGPRLRGNGELINSGDLGVTFHIMKLFVDEQGSDRHKDFPMRYKDKLFLSILQKLSEPMPADADLGEIHDWSLTRSQGLKALVRYLWKDAYPENKNNAKKLMEQLVINRFEKFYIQSQGGFSLYPGTDEATLDGTGSALGLLDYAGALSRSRQEFLWGPIGKYTKYIEIYRSSSLKQGDFDLIKNQHDINSIRLYNVEPNLNDYESNVISIIYPRKTPVLDTMDLLPRIKKWVDTTPQDMGNWTSRKDVIGELTNVGIQPIPVSMQDIPLKMANEVLEKNGKITLIGFDVLQVPRYKIKFYCK